MNGRTEIGGATRLQLGTSRLERVGKAHPVFLDRSWVHLGDPDPGPPAPWPARLVSTCQEYGLIHLTKVSVERLRQIASREEPIPAGELYSKTNFQPWFYAKGDALPFDEASFSFIFSEHFFEHLFFDEAVALMNECRRVLKPGGVLRTAVPDADLRVDLPPEPVGFPSRKLPWTHPAKHKTRWSVYMLDQALRIAGLEPVWVHYCDKLGVMHSLVPGDSEAYETCIDRAMTDRLDYVLREGSLIVDGVVPGRV